MAQRTTYGGGEPVPRVATNSWGIAAQGKGYGLHWGGPMVNSNPQLPSGVAFMVGEGGSVPGSQLGVGPG